MSDADDEEVEFFDIDDREQCHRVLSFLIDTAKEASLMRVVWGCAVMLDPANELVDPAASSIEHHPKRQQLEKQVEELLAWKFKNERHARLGAAVDGAAGLLPEGYDLHIEIEQGAGTVRLYLPDTDACLSEFAGDEFADYISSAVKTAIYHHKENSMTNTANAIAMQPVESSQIAAIGHDPETNTLAIQFAAKSGTGSVYHYSGFTAEDFAAFSGSESIGAHFGKHIKPFAEKYPYTKITDAKADATVGLPRYKCHKEVRALKIADIGNPNQPGAEDDGSRMIVPAEEGYAPFTVDHSYMSKHKPEVGGYYVVYADGYQSYSPAAAFESGYSRI